MISPLYILLITITCLVALLVVYKMTTKNHLISKKLINSLCLSIAAIGTVLLINYLFGILMAVFSAERYEVWVYEGKEIPSQIEIVGNVVFSVFIASFPLFFWFRKARKNLSMILFICFLIIITQIILVL